MRDAGAPGPAPRPAMGGAGSPARAGGAGIAVGRPEGAVTARDAASGGLAIGRAAGDLMGLPGPGVPAGCGAAGTTDSGSRPLG